MKEKSVYMFSYTNLIALFSIVWSLTSGCGTPPPLGIAPTESTYPAENNLGNLISGITQTGPHAAANNILDPTLGPALSEAVALGNMDTVRTLLQSGADPNYVSEDEDQQMTPLHIAVAFRRTHKKCCIQELLRYGARLNATDRRGCTPLHLAVRNAGNHLEVVQLLLEKGADMNAQDESGNVPLNLASHQTRRAVADLFDAFARSAAFARS